MKNILVIILTCMVAVVYAQKKPNINKAQNLLTSGNLEEAKAIIDEAIQHEKTKEKDKTWYYRGLIYASIDTAGRKDLSSNALEEAMKSFDKAIALNNGKKDGFYMLDQYGLPTQTLDVQLNMFWSTYLNKGVKAYEKKDYDKALKNLEKCTVVMPKDTTAYLYGGQIAQEGGKNDVALKNYYKLLDLNYDDALTYKRIIFLEISENEDYDKALELTREALKKYPDDADLKTQEVALLQKTNKFDEAITQLEKEVKDNPNSAAAYYNLATMYDRNKNKEKAAENYKKAIELNSKYFEAYFNLAVLYINTGVEKWKEAKNMSIQEYQERGKEVETEAKEDYRKALPHMESAYANVNNAQNPLPTDEVDVLRTLEKLYAQLEMKEELDDVRAKLKAKGEAVD